MEKITENRHTVIRDKIVTLQNVRALAKILVGQLENLNAEERVRADIYFIARCDDGSSYQSDDIELFSDESIIIQKRVTNVTLEYRYYPTKARVEVALQHGSSGGVVTVSGKNRVWVAGTLDSLNGLFASFTPQKNPYQKHAKVIGTAVALGIGSIFVFLLGSIPVVPPREEDRQKYMWINTAISYPPAFFAIKYLMSWMVGLPWAISVRNRFSKLWPSIELQIGPEHFFVEKSRRKLIAGVFSLAVLPLTLAVIYDAMKVFSGH